MSEQAGLPEPIVKFSVGPPQRLIEPWNLHVARDRADTPEERAKIQAKIHAKVNERPA